MTVKDIKKYGKKSAFSYTFGAFPTFELLHNKPEAAEMILTHSDLNAEIRDRLKRECEKQGVKTIQSDRHIEKIRDKDNCVIIGVFGKYRCKLAQKDNHVVLVNPGDAGNLGTVIRSCAGFGIDGLAVIEPAVDIFHPKTVRASMGALFGMRFEYFESFERYYREYGNGREIYPFMLNGKYRLGTFEPSKNKPYSLVFGNEAGGLDAAFLNVGKSVVIPHTDAIDSLNLSMAAAIGIYEFRKPSISKAR